MDLTALMDLLDRVPESIWGAIVGAMLTLIPVVMTNRHNRKQLAQQLDFESRERQRERRVNLRRDVYFPAADAVVNMVSAMAKMLGGDPATTQEVTAGAQVFVAALTRIQMVGTAEVVKHVGEYQRVLLKAISVLQRLNHPMMLRKIDIDIAHNARSGFHDERMKYIEMMKEYNLAGTHDPQRFQRIERQAAFARKQREEAHSEWLQLMLAQETARLEMLRELGNQMNELSQLQAPVLAAIRRELEVPL
jgi:hypothetical protein